MSRCGASDRLEPADDPASGAVWGAATGEAARHGLPRHGRVCCRTRPPGRMTRDPEQPSSPPGQRLRRGSRRRRTPDHPRNRTPARRHRPARGSKILRNVDRALV